MRFANSEKDGGLVGCKVSCQKTTGEKKSVQSGANCEGEI